MRTLWLAVIFLVAAGVAAQVAPEVDVGASPEAVIRSYGWPRGRSSSADREVWQYDAFEVTFEQGHVVRVVPIPGARPPARKPVPATPPTRATPQLPRSPARPAVRPSPGLTSNPAPTLRTVPRAADRPVGATSHPDPRNPLDVVTHSLVALVWRLALLVGAFAAVVLAVALNRRRRTRSHPPAPAAQAASTPPTATDAIAATLAKFHARGSASVPPVIAGGGSLPALTLARLQQLEWKRFEAIVARYFEAQGLRCERTRGGADGGVDAYLYRQAETRPFASVQCKSWNTCRVNVKPVRELFGVMAAEQVPQGFFVTTADFTEEAQRWATGKPLQLMDGAEFLRRYNSLSADTRARIEAEVFAGDFRTPTCPRCDVKLVPRVNSHDQSTFWSCCNFPRCRYTLNAANAAY